MIDCLGNTFPILKNSITSRSRKACGYQLSALATPFTFEVESDTHLKIFLVQLQAVLNVELCGTRKNYPACHAVLRL